MYYETDDQLLGFYGTKTVDDILGSQASRAKARRATVAKLPTVTEGKSQGADESTATKPSEYTEYKGNKLKKVFSRRKTVA